MKKRITLDVSNILSAIKTWILERHKEENIKAKSSGAMFGKTNIPKQGEPITMYIQPIIDAYALIWKDVKQRLDNLTNEIEAVVQQLQKGAEKLNDLINGLERKIAHQEAELSKYQVEYPLGLFIVLVLSVVGLLGAETVYNSRVFGLLELSWVFTFFLACAITIGMVIAFYQRSRLMQYAKTKWQKALILLVWVIGFTLFFYLLSDYRNEYVKEVSEGKEFSVTLFILFNWIMLGASEFIIAKLPKTEDVKAILKRIAIKKDIARARQAKEKAETELSEILKVQSHYNSRLVNMPNERDNLKELVRISMSQSCSDFLLENIKHRKDGHRPDGGYNGPEEPLTLG